MAPGQGIEIKFHNGKEDIMNFKVIISPNDGYHHKGTFVFDIRVPKSYPHDPPKVLCETAVFHPNIDQEGHVCLNILREDWKPVLTMQSIIMGLQFLFVEPNPHDPLNKEAAQLLADHPVKFKEMVAKTFKGQSLPGYTYEFPKFT